MLQPQAGAGHPWYGAAKAARRNGNIGRLARAFSGKVEPVFRPKMRSMKKAGMFSFH